MADLRKLGRRTDHRNSLLRNQVQSLFENGKIETTVTRAKETRRVAEKMITLGKKGEKHKQATEAVAKSQLKAAEAEYQIYIKNSIPNANAIKKEIDKANAEAKKIAARIIGRQIRMSRGRTRDEMFRKQRRLLG